ncbi:MAG: terminase [bacterium]|nr:terminase [bacterium]
MPQDPSAQIVWKPNFGGQLQFISSPVFELLGEGDRGGGKSETGLMDYLKDVGTGLGPSWRGAVFRETFTELEDIIAKSEALIPRIFPKAKFKAGNRPMWVFEGGEKLQFLAAKRASDYWKFHGWELPWQLWEELTNWREPDLYLQMFSCARSSNPKVKPRIRATANSAGPGHSWVKKRLIDIGPPGTVAFDERQIPDGEGGFKTLRLSRARVKILFSENTPLLQADPEYQARLNPPNEAYRQAWLNNNWDIVAGGAFDGLWDAQKHLLPYFDIPRGWTIRRAYDWGFSAPFAVLWVAKTNGEEVPLALGRRFAPPKGSYVVLGEWYGWNGEPNQGLRLLDLAIGQGIAEREAQMGLRGRVMAGAADTSIFNGAGTASSPAADMGRSGISFIPAEKGPGSRATGYRKICQLLQNAAEERPTEPGLWVVETCRQLIRTLPGLQLDPSNPDDLDTQGEDHLYDALRYELTSTSGGLVSLKQKQF